MQEWKLLVELLRTNDAVRLSWLTALLAAEGIEAVVLDTHTSILEGSIGAIPRRIAVTFPAASISRSVSPCAFAMSCQVWARTVS